MNKIIFVLAFVLMGTFAFANNNVELSSFNSEEIVELVKPINQSEILSSKIEIKELIRLDICTITVSTVDSDGNIINSISVTNHEGDCIKARNLAYLILGLL